MNSLSITDLGFTHSSSMRQNGSVDSALRSATATIPTSPHPRLALDAPFYALPSGSTSQEGTEGNETTNSSPALASGPANDKMGNRSCKAYALIPAPPALSHPFPVEVSMNTIPEYLRMEIFTLGTSPLLSTIKSTLQSSPKLYYKRRKWSPELPQSQYPSDAGRKDSCGVYTGTWLGNKRHGFGMYRWDNGRIYVGEWIENTISGKGIYVWPIIENSVGVVMTSRKHKFDRYQYQGEWKENKRSGWGTYIFPDGRIYEGQWVDDKLHGHGILYWSDGSVFKGKFEDDHIEGLGVRLWSNGSYYKGEWKSDKKHGKGSYVFPDKNSRYEGEWKSDQMDGEGKMIWYKEEDGFPMVSQFEGTWVNGKREGKGKFTNHDGTVLEGDWKDDEFVDGSYKTPVGFVYKSK